MRANSLSIHSGQNSALTCYNKAILLITLIFVLVTLVPLDHLSENLPFSSQSRERHGNVSVPLQGHQQAISPSGSVNASLADKCNMFSGKWVPYPRGPQYSNRTECGIGDGQNCMKFGRPDSEFMKWRWKPDECELPLFDAAQFLELVRGKSMAFVGDSVARNQVQSLVCLLSSVALPVNESNKTDQRIGGWFYADYNFTIQLLSTTHLVKSRGVDPLSVKPIDLYLDKADESWATQIVGFDYVIISTGHWFSRPLTYHEKQKITGCHMCKSNTTADLTRYYGYRKALQTAFRTLLDQQRFKGMVFLRTISPTHFEAEEWEGRGNCVRRRPFKKQEVGFDWYLSMFHMLQKEEFKAAKKEGKERGLKFRLLDITEAMRLRPDGHPNHYGHPPEKKKSSADCLHWCLPGPIDTWNELLFYMLKAEEGKQGPDDH